MSINLDAISIDMNAWISLTLEQESVLVTLFFS
jgi:hypothetical protein